MEYLECLTETPKERLYILIACLFTIPLSMLFNKIQNIKFRHIYNIFVGMSLGFTLMGINGFIHTIISSIVVYLLCKYTKNIKINLFQFRINIKTVNIVWIWSTFYMFWTYCNRLYITNNPHQIDHSVIQMMVTAKLTSFASNIYFSTLEEKLEMNKYWKKYAIHNMPSLLEYFGYMFFYQTYLIGPFVQFNDYMDHIKNNNFNQKSKKLAYIARLFHTFVVFTFYLILKSFYNSKHILEPEFYNKTLWERFIYIYMTTITFRLMYEFVWSLVDSNLIFSGFSYQTDTIGNEYWLNFINIDLSCEFTPTVRGMISKWNINIQQWLQHYCYERFEHNKYFGMIVTNMLSAFWHGLSIGYYLAFAIGSIYIYTGREWNRKIKPILRPYTKNPIFYIFWYIVNISITSVAICFAFIPFIYLNLYDIYLAYKTLYFIPLFIMFGCVIIFKYIPTPILKSH